MIRLSLRVEREPNPEPALNQWTLGAGPSFPRVLNIRVSHFWGGNMA